MDQYLTGWIDNKQNVYIELLTLALLLLTLTCAFTLLHTLVFLHSPENTVCSVYTTDSLQLAHCHVFMQSRSQGQTPQPSRLLTLQGHFGDWYFGVNHFKLSHKMIHNERFTHKLKVVTLLSRSNASFWRSQN